MVLVVVASDKRRWESSLKRRTQQYGYEYDYAAVRGNDSMQDTTAIVLTYLRSVWFTSEANKTHSSFFG